MDYETKKLKTKRLVIKRGIEEDFIKVYEYDFNKLQNVDGVFRLVKQDSKSIKELFKNGIDKYYDKIKKAHMFDWIIYKDKTPIGNVLAMNEDKKSNAIELVFNIHPAYWGNGYMKEALEEVIEYLYKVGFDNIICTYYEGNKKAKRVLDKLGFKPFKISPDAIKSTNGNLLDIYKLVMTKEDWFSKTGRLTKIEL